MKKSIVYFVSCGWYKISFTDCNSSKPLKRAIVCPSIFFSFTASS